MNPSIKTRLSASLVALFGLAGVCMWLPATAEAIPTSNSGAAYITECANAGVPIPPDWGDFRPGKWIRRGALTNPFISQTLTGVIYYYVPPGGGGVCMALPRMQGANGPVILLGIICQSNVTSKACFWDNSFPGGAQFNIASETTPTPLSSFNGGAGLYRAAGNVCTGCHAGENVFNIQPGTALDLSVVGVQTKPAAYVQPIVPAQWPQNTTPSTIPGACATACHNQGNVGRLPELYKELGAGYFCDAELGGAWKNKTMPAAPYTQTEEFCDHFTTMQQTCMNLAPPTATPSNRLPAQTNGEQMASMWMASGG